MPTRTLLTGATGFLGSALARALLARGEELRLLVRPESDRRNIAGLAAELVEGRLEDEESLRRAVDGVSSIHHCAAHVSFLRRDRREMERSIVQGTASLLRAAEAAGVERFVHVSSIAAVGRCASAAERLTEESPYDLARLRIPYCDAKHAAEGLVRDAARRGLHAVIVNPTQILGPGDRRSPEGSILHAIAAGRVPFAPPGGTNVVDVADVVSGMIAAMEYGRPGERYLLGGENLAHEELVERTLRILGRPRRVRRMPRLPYVLLCGLAGIADRARLLRGDVSAGLLRIAGCHLYADCSKAERELGFASYPIDIAIKACFDQWLDRDLIDPGLVGGVGRV